MLRVRPRPERTAKSSPAMLMRRPSDSQKYRARPKAGGSLAERCGAHARVSDEYFGLGESGKSARRIFSRHSSGEHHVGGLGAWFLRRCCWKSKLKRSCSTESKLPQNVKKGAGPDFPISALTAPSRIMLPAAFFAGRFFLGRFPGWLSSLPLSFSRQASSRLSLPASFSPFSWRVPSWRELELFS